MLVLASLFSRAEHTPNAIFPTRAHRSSTTASLEYLKCSVVLFTDPMTENVTDWKGEIQFLGRSIREVTGNPGTLALLLAVTPHRLLPVSLHTAMVLDPVCVFIVLLAEGTVGCLACHGVQVAPCPWPGPCDSVPTMLTGQCRGHLCWEPVR